MKGDIQDVKHEVALALRSAGFLSVLAAVDLEKGITPATPGPTSVFEGEKAVKDDQGFPVVEVIGVRTLYATDDQQTKDATHEINVVWTQVGDDELMITAQLERLVRATRDFFWPTNGPSLLTTLATVPITVVSEEYTALMPGRIHPFLKGSATTLRIGTLTL